MDAAAFLHTGVPPGRYEVVWVLALPQNRYHTDRVTLNMSATAESLGLEPMPPTATHISSSSSSGGSNGGSNGGRGGSSGGGPSAGASVQAAAAAAADLLRSLFSGGSGARAAGASDNATNSTATTATVSNSDTSRSGDGVVEGDGDAGSSSSVTLTLKMNQMAAKIKPLPARQSEGGVEWGSLSGGCCSCGGQGGGAWEAEGDSFRLAWWV